MSAPVPTGSGNGQATTAGSTGREEDDYSQDQVKVYSHEGDGENTEHLNSMDLHDIKTELERDAEKAETPKSATNAASSPTFNSDGGSTIATTSSALPQTSIRPVIHHPTAAMVYANGSPLPFMIPPIPGGSPFYPVMRPVKVESDWKVAQSATGQVSIPTYTSYPTGFLPVDQSGLRPAYPFMTIPGQYVAAQMPYQQFATLGQSVAPNAAVQPNTGGMLAPQVKEKKPHIKKPLNAFMLFMKQKRADVIKECTLKESAAINQILGKMWHALDRSEQAKYYEMAREERAKHMQMYPGWSARDNYAVHKKRRKRKVKQVENKVEESIEERSKEDKDTLTQAVVPLATVPHAPPINKESISPTKTAPTFVQHTEDDDTDLNNRKCRARFGLEQQHMWCGPCRRKKKCTRFSVDEDEHIPELVAKDVSSEAEDDVIVNPGGVAGSAEASVMAGDSHCDPTAEDLPNMLRHSVPVTLQTIPT